MSNNDADIAALYDWVVRQAPPETLLVELGVWTGTSLVAMAESARSFGRDDLRIVGVDLWKGSAGEPDLVLEAERRDLYGECISRLQGADLLDRVALLRYDSIRAASLFSDHSVYFVFHDSCHLEDHVRNEIAAWAPKVSPEGVQAGHDISHPGVAAAVQATFGKVARHGSCWEVHYASR